jgi:aminopeptidase N
LHRKIPKYARRLQLKHLASVLVVGLFVFIAISYSIDILAQQTDIQPAEFLYTDQNTTPSEFHRMMAEMKQDRLNRLRESGITLSTEGSIAQGEYDVRYYQLNLTLNDTTEVISGSVYIYAFALIDGFNAVELNFFDNPLMSIDSAKSKGSNCSFSWNSNIIRVVLKNTYDSNEPFDLTVYYHGHPQEGGLQSFDWGYHGTPSVPIMCTLSEPYFAQAWWPCKDVPKDKADSADINITVRSDLYATSNGLLREIVDNGSTKTYKWHEKYPITTYLISLAATNYSIFSNWYHPIAGDSMQVLYYAYPEKLSYAQALWPITPSMIQYFANTFGEYPFVEEKYGMSHFTWTGAMEHQTNTSILSTWYSEWVVVHELAHQWWGDYITIHDWHQIWLNEGFASYCEALWAEYKGGESNYHTYMAGMKYTGAGTIFVEDTADVWNIFSSIVYDKGAWVLHMLRHVVGDDDFFDILKTYYADPRFAHNWADTDGFKEICETVSGMDLDYFFDQWIYGTYYPQYQYSYITEPVGDSQYDVFIHIDQIQTTEPTHFTMPVDLKITTSTMDTMVVIFNDTIHKDIRVRVPSAITGVALDPEQWILRSASTVAYGMNIVTTEMPRAWLSTTYIETLLAKGGTPPYTWEMLSGSLPGGLVLDPSTGVISGIPTAEESLEFVVRVTDSSLPAKTDIQELYIVVGSFSSGDVNGDGKINLGDVIYILNYLFKNGPAPITLEVADLNCDSLVNLVDAIYLLNFLFKNGPPPC